MNRATGYAFLRAVVAAAFLILIGRLWYMQVVEVNSYRAQAVSTRLQERIVLAPRGVIYDRNGVPLVRNRPRLDVTVTPNEWAPQNALRESKLLSRLLHHHPRATRIRAMVAAHRQDPTRPFIVKMDITLNTFYVVRSYTDQLPGVYASESLSHRVYLGRRPWPMAHILGYVGPIDSSEWALDNDRGSWAFQRYTEQDSVGQTGVESQFEHQLHDINGVQSSQIDALGNQITPWKTVKRAAPGDGILLTINSRFENQVAQDLQAGLEKLRTSCCPLGTPRQGAAVVMNPWNGQILAMVGLPSYNPDIFTQAETRRRSRQVSRLESPTNPLKPLFDVTTQSALPPGSIYKVVTATAGLESGVLKPSTLVDDTGILQRCPTCHAFHGWQGPPGLGEMDLVKAIAESSDIYFYEAAGGGPDIPGEGIGPKRLGRWARRYGLGQVTGIQLPGENGGLVPSPSEVERTQHRPWSYGDSYNMGIGQGDNEVTPLQMVRVVSVIANGGSLVKPTIIRALTGPNGRTILRGQNYGLVPDVLRPHFVARWVTNLIGEGMRLGVTWGSPGSPIGTSYGQVNPKTEAAGKTGTAQTPQGATAWWMGFAPYGHPKIAVCVSIPGAWAEGAWAAAPIASKIMMDYFHKADPHWLNKVSKVLDVFN